MSTQITTLQDRIEQIASKSGKTAAEVQAAYDIALTTVPANVKKDNRRQKMALMIVNRDLAVNTKSTAEAYEGIIVGARRVKDLMERVRTNALEEYETDPQAAIDAGLVRVEGDKVVVLDNRTEVGGQPNKKLGQPRPETMFLRDLIIAARKPGEDSWTIGTMQLWNQQAKLTLPVLQKVSFVANGGIEDGEFILRSSVDTIFEIAPDTTDEEVIGVLDEWRDSNLFELGELFEFHTGIKNTPEYWDSYVITEGSVVWPPQEFANSIKLVITDDSIPKDDPHADGITVWLPKELEHLVNFGKGSFVTVVARTGDGKFYDRKLKQQTEQDIVQLNALSVIGRPGLTKPKITDGETI